MGLVTSRTFPLWQSDFFLVNLLGVATLVGFGEKRCRKPFVVRQTTRSFMPYGYPWELTREPKGYRCPYCKKANWGPYQPFCGQCGKELPSQDRLLLTGYAEQYDRMIGVGQDAIEINTVLRDIGHVEIWLQMYSASHRETDLRFRLSDGRFSGDYALICSGTLLILSLIHI